MRQKLTDSPNKNIPARTVKTAPIPPHTAYAVPISMPFSPLMALNSRNILIETLTRKDKSHSMDSFPVEQDIFSKLKANAASNNPPMIRKIQFM